MKKILTIVLFIFISFSIFSQSSLDAYDYSSLTKEQLTEKLVSSTIALKKTTDALIKTVEQLKKSNEANISLTNLVEKNQAEIEKLRSDIVSLTKQIDTRTNSLYVAPTYGANGFGASSLFKLDLNKTPFTFIAGAQIDNKLLWNVLLGVGFKF